MRFEDFEDNPCYVCSAPNANWRILQDKSQYHGRYLCRNHEHYASDMNLIKQVDAQWEEFNKSTIARAKEVEQMQKKKSLHPLQAEFGFTRPEDGSKERWAERRQKYHVPWAQHTFFWIIHNAVAHPLIAFAPIRIFFRFHDWTSRKMHGAK